MEHGELRRARAWCDAAVRRLPAYVPAQGHLAELDAALGDTAAAIAPPSAAGARIRRSRYANATRPHPGRRRPQRGGTDLARQRGSPLRRTARASPRCVRRSRRRILAHDRRRPRASAPARALHNLSLRQTPPRPSASCADRAAPRRASRDRRPKLRTPRCWTPGPRLATRTVPLADTSAGPSRHDNRRQAARCRADRASKEAEGSSMTGR